MSTQRFDAVVVGASLAGCTTATLLARRGAKVALIERHADRNSYKQLCTHFIQPSALPVLQRLGLDRLIEDTGGVRNPIEMYTESGWVGWHLGDEPDDAPDYGYNVRRLRLDPLVRQLAADTPGVSLMTGLAARNLVERNGTIAGVDVAGAGIAQHTLEAPLVVAADGRNSSLADMAGVEPSLVVAALVVSAVRSLRPRQAPEPARVILRYPEQAAEPVRSAEQDTSPGESLTSISNTTWHSRGT